MSEVLAVNLLESLNGVTAAKVDIDSGNGHLTVDGVAEREKLLVNGTSKSTARPYVN